jgi:hypothetical protein
MKYPGNEFVWTMEQCYPNTSLRLVPLGRVVNRRLKVVISDIGGRPTEAGLVQYDSCGFNYSCGFDG